MTPRKGFSCCRRLALLLLALLATAAVARAMTRAIPHAVAVLPDGGSFREFAAAFAQAPFPCCVLQEAAAMAATPEKEQPVPVTLTAASAGYAYFLPEPFLCGGFYQADAVREGRRYAVIPDSLALDRFLTCDAVGRTLSVAGAEYTVCGVYEASRDLFSRMSRPAAPRVYVSAAPEGAPGALRLLLGGDETMGAPQVMARASQPPHRAVTGDVRDWRTVRRLMASLGYLAFFFCGLYPVFLLLQKAWKLLVGLAARHPLEKKTLLRLLCAFGLLAAGFWLFHRLLRGLTFPAAYLPPDDLFQLSHYGELIVSACQTLFVPGRFDPCAQALAVLFPWWLFSLALTAYAAIRLEVGLRRLFATPKERT